MLALALLAAAPVAPGQTAANPQQPEGIFLSTDPIRIEAIGLSIYAPEDAGISSEMLAGTSITTIAPRSASKENLPWVISIQSRTTSNSKLELKAVADQAQAQMLNTAAENVIQVTREDAINMRTSALSSTDGTIDTRNITAHPTDGESAATLMLREPEEGKSLTLGGPSNPIPVQRFYVQFPNSAAARNSSPVIRGVTIAKIAATQFVTFELYTTTPNWERARKIYETVVASATFENPEKAVEQRAMLVKAGMRLFEQVSEDDLVALVDNQPERWERIYRPSPTGKRTDDQEVGYRRVRTLFGPRTLVDKSSSNRGVLAQDKGLIVQIDARYLDNEQIVDSQSIFFMSVDRREEIWSIVMTLRDGKEGQKTVHRESGARTDKAMSVRVESPGQDAKSIMPQIAGDGYISRAESFLLPRLLVRKKLAAPYGFYAYRSEAETIQFRRDILAQPKSANEPWKLTSRLAEGQPEQVLQLDNDGNLAKGTLPGGLQTEPIELRDLLALWKAKGLPTD